MCANYYLGAKPADLSATGCTGCSMGRAGIALASKSLGMAAVDQPDRYGQTPLWSACHSQVFFPVSFLSGGAGGLVDPQPLTQGGMEPDGTHFSAPKAPMFF